MDAFFDALEKTNSVPASIEVLKKLLLKRKLDIVDDGRAYEEISEEFNKLLKLRAKAAILSKAVSSKAEKSVTNNK